MSKPLGVGVGVGDGDFKFALAASFKKGLVAAIAASFQAGFQAGKAAASTDSFKQGYECHNIIKTHEVVVEWNKAQLTKISGRCYMALTPTHKANLFTQLRSALNFINVIRSTCKDEDANIVIDDFKRTCDAIITAYESINYAENRVFLNHAENTIKAAKEITSITPIDTSRLETATKAIVEAVASAVDSIDNLDTAVYAIEAMNRKFAKLVKVLASYGHIIPGNVELTDMLRFS